MSATQPPALETEPIDDLTPVVVPADVLASTARSYLRECKRRLAAEDRVPAAIRATAAFDEDRPLATQAEADELRELVRAAAFLGAGRLEVNVTAVADEAAVETALGACAERARREGVDLVVEGPVEVASDRVAPASDRER